MIQMALRGKSPLASTVGDGGAVVGSAVEGAVVGGTAVAGAFVAGAAVGWITVGDTFVGAPGVGVGAIGGAPPHPATSTINDVTKKIRMFLFIFNSIPFLVQII
jgi:hypothetical protein